MSTTTRQPCRCAAAAALALFLGTALAAAQTGGRPGAGFNIVVNPKAGGPTAFVAASTRADGRFSATIQLQHPGVYEIFPACPGGALCPSHELVWLTINGQAVPRGENPALNIRGRGVYTVTAPAAGSSVAIAGEVRMVAVEAPRGPAARAPDPRPPRQTVPRRAPATLLQGDAR